MINDVRYFHTLFIKLKKSLTLDFPMIKRPLPKEENNSD